MLANLQNYLEIKHDCLLIYVNRVISQGGDQGDRSLIFYFERGRDSGVKATSVFSSDWGTSIA